ncbi:MAG: hypothetical protein LBT26_03450 [Clostridiales Family XIII bacterium]|nr:hypothetical protein [Clostridiales Family XIII bacterium]
MKLIGSTLAGISREPSLRFDYDFHQYKNVTAEDSYAFSELFILNDSLKVSIDDLRSDFLYCEIGNTNKDGDISPELLNFDNRDLLNESYYAKIEKGDIIPVDHDDILLSKVRPNLRKFVRVTAETSGIYFTNAFISLKPKTMPAVLYYCLRGIFHQNLIAISRQGKGYPTLNANDLLLLKFDKKIIDALSADSGKISDQILEIENVIRTKKTTIKPVQAIVDEVFAHEFGFDYATFENIKKQRTYTAKLSALANNPDLRFSAKFHRAAGAFVMEQLTAVTDKKIKNFLTEPIVLGASVSPGDFDEDGAAYYVSMATIKTLEAELDESQLLSSAYYAAHKEKEVRAGDIIMARSGVAIGKTALIKEEFDGIFADFTMRIRLSNFIPQFACYYFRTAYFQYLIEIYKKGLQNKNIFPIVIQEFPMIDIPLSEQERIVSKIRAETDKQSAIKAEISDLRRKIDEIIETASVP